MDENIDGLIKAFKDTEKLLFHYTSFNSAIKIIKSGKLLYSKLSKLNDPLESHRSSYYDDYNSSKTEIIQNEISKYHQISLTKDTVCRRGFDINAMWGHYADKGNGVCLVFDKNQLEGQLKKGYVFHKEIHYSSSYDNSITVEGDVSKYFKEHIDDIFFKKAESWSYEQEYRIIKKFEENGKKSIDISKLIIAIIMYNSNSIKDGDSIFGSTEYSIIKKITDKTILEYGSLLGEMNLITEYRGQSYEIWPKLIQNASLDNYDKEKYNN